MTKKELITEIAAGLAEQDKTMTNAAIERVLDQAAIAIQEALNEGEEVAIAGIGKFKVAERAERKARNPQTGELMTVPAHKVVAFKAAKTLRESLN